MSEQLPPLESQRRHWYLNVIGAVPPQFPLFAVRVLPSEAVPLMVGGEVFEGAVATWAVAAIAATANAAATATVIMRVLARRDGHRSRLSKRGIFRLL
jgi:hypothetical protein